MLQPTYNCYDLIIIIPTADPELLKAISRTVRAERELYDSYEYSRTLVLISRRLIAIGKTLVSIH